MELATIVYSTLAIIFSLVFLLIIVSYLGYKMNRREEPARNPAILSQQNLRMNASFSGEKKLY